MTTSDNQVSLSSFFPCSQNRRAAFFVGIYVLTMSMQVFTPKQSLSLANAVKIDFTMFDVFQYSAIPTLTAGTILALYNSVASLKKYAYMAKSLFFFLVIISVGEFIYSANVFLSDPNAGVSIYILGKSGYTISENALALLAVSAIAAMMTLFSKVEFGAEK